MVSFTTGSGDTSVVVSTDAASSIGETTATLNGELTDLGGAASADCYFQYRPSGTSSGTSTAAQTLSSTVVVEVLDESGTVVDSARTSVSGASGAGTDSFKLKHAGGSSYDVRLTVTDAAGNSVSRTGTVSS